MLIYLSLIEEQAEKEWFVQLYQNNYKKMYKVVYRMLESQNDAENAVHDAFLSIAEHIDKYKKLDEREAMGLCIIVAKHKAIDILREKKMYCESDILEYITPMSEKENPESLVINQEEKENFYRLLLSLPEVLSSVLIMKYYYGYGNKEIATLLQITKKTADMRLYRGKKQLREMLQEEKNNG